MNIFNFKSVCKFSIMARPKIIILAHSNSFSNYSFLGLNLSGINSTFASVWSQANSPPLSDFMKTFNQYRYAVQHVQNNQYGYKQLILLEKKQPCAIFSKYKNELIELKDKYQTLCDHVVMNVRKQNLFLWLQVCSKLGIIESTVWSKLFSIIIQNFIDFNINQQADIIDYTHDYVKGKFISFTYAPSKFIYRENYLVDITNFRGLLKAFINFILKSPNDGTLLKSNYMQKINDLLEKISKIYVINFLEMTVLYNKNKVYFEQIVKDGSTETLVEVLRYLSIIGMLDKKFISQIEEKIIAKFTKQKSILNQKLVSRILAIWANIYHHNQFMFTTFIKPFIEVEIAKGAKSRYHSVWLFNIAASNIRDFQLLERFSSKILNDLPLSNKYVHIVSHYLAVLQDSKRTDAFPTCVQHPLTAKILQKYGKTHHNCMQRQNSLQYQDQNNLTVINQLGIEENPSQSFWLHIARKSFQILNKRYPHPDNCIHFDFHFCVFRLDAIIMLQRKAVAFELGGSHYNLKNESEKMTDQAQGKKVIKSIILKGYGIQTLQINSTNLIERNLNSFNDSVGGVKYVIQKFQAILSSKP